MTLAAVPGRESVETRKRPARRHDGAAAVSLYGVCVKLELPVIWRVDGPTHAGRIELAQDRVRLTSKIETVSFETSSVEGVTIERGPGQRLRGLPVLAVDLGGGEVVRVASMGGGGSLHALASWVCARQPAPTGT